MFHSHHFFHKAPHYLPIHHLMTSFHERSDAPGIFLCLSIFLCRLPGIFLCRSGFPKSPPQQLKTQLIKQKIQVRIHTVRKMGRWWPAITTRPPLRNCTIGACSTIPTRPPPPTHSSPHLGNFLSKKYNWKMPFFTQNLIKVPGFNYRSQKNSDI